MKILVFIWTLLFCTVQLFGQNYLRGYVASTTGQRIPSVKINAVEGKQVVKTNMFGNFGFSSPLSSDSLIFSCDGYDSSFVRVKADNYIKVLMKPLPSSVIFTKDNFSVLLNKASAESERNFRDETYLPTGESYFINTKRSPGIAFSANINRASYSNVRRLINEMDGLLPPGAIRIEEMLNYFSFNYTEPPKDSMFHCSTTLTQCPWNKKNELLFINISAKKIDMANRPPNNLILLIDASGSMDMPAKLPLLKSGFIKMVNNLRPVDTVSLITFGDKVSLVLEAVPGNEKEKIIKAISKLEADGPTPAEGAIRLAYKIANKRYISQGNNRIILAADGDFNVGMSTEKELITLIEQEKRNGIYLTCLGVGSGNYKDSRLAVLAQKGNGNFSYIDNEQEAERILVTDLSKSLFTVADNVYLSLLFNAERVKSYRLLGYENEKVALNDSLVQLKGGEIGSGHNLMAMVEIEPSTTPSPNPLAKLEIYYRYPLQKEQYHNSFAIPANEIMLKTAVPGLRKAIAVVMFAMKLKDNENSKKISWRMLQNTAKESMDKDNYLDKEFIQLVYKAKRMYTHRRKYGG
ncbi:MAG: von Willebrand factor type A domain-containing protein [Niastella sp.]|nr:von Willebrand factor type A domain-containing protein [Niastella sp.]